MAKTEQAKKAAEPSDKKGGIPITCPKCGGHNVYVEKTKTHRYPTFLKRTRYCFCENDNCRHAFPLATIIEERPVK